MADCAGSHATLDDARLSVSSYLEALAAEKAAAEDEAIRARTGVSRHQAPSTGRAENPREPSVELEIP